MAALTPWRRRAASSIVSSPASKRLVVTGAVRRWRATDGQPVDASGMAAGQQAELALHSARG
ncbi:hypothetical protein JNW88_29595 [Micromonospora sp. ATA32]|nr:hypothetical protein [Micromonospora sp. ATA32]